MYFDVFEYPNFIEECKSIGSWWGTGTWSEVFSNAGFKTYRIDKTKMGKSHWLDDEEFTWFVLRFS
jgi:hypothetical protein